MNEVNDYGFVDELDEHLNHKTAFELDPDLWNDQDEKGGSHGNF